MSRRRSSFLGGKKMSKEDLMEKLKEDPDFDPDERTAMQKKDLSAAGATSTWTTAT